MTFLCVFLIRFLLWYSHFLTYYLFSCYFLIVFLLCSYFFLYCFFYLLLYFRTQESRELDKRGTEGERRHIRGTPAAYPRHTTNPHRSWRGTFGGCGRPPDNLTSTRKRNKSSMRHGSHLKKRAFESDECHR